jgi:hypothetical protein
MPTGSDTDYGASQTATKRAVPDQMGDLAVMTYPPAQPDPYPAPGPYGPGQPPPASGESPGQPDGWSSGGGQYGAPGDPMPPGQPGVPGQQGGWGQPYATPPGTLGQSGDYAASPTDSPRRRSLLPWIVAGGTGLLIVALILVFTLGGTTGSPKATAQAYADSINARKVDKSLYCESFLQRAENLPGNLPTDLPDLPGVPNLPEITLSASVGEVSQDGDTARAAVRVDSELLGQKISSTQHLTIKKEDGAWKICDIAFGPPELRGG